MSKISRRQFVKKTVISGAAITAFPHVFIRKANAAWEPRTIVHPNVDNLRVVSITDTKMTKAFDPNSTWIKKDERIIKKVVWENIDKLACSLAQTQNTEDAWRTVFVKPPRKPWSEAVVAIKTNNVNASSLPRSAVISKVCHSLINILGIKPFNIHIYDARHGHHMETIIDLPEGCRMEKLWGGITAETKIPNLWNINDGQTMCLKHLVDGTVDILINIAKCKRHGFYFLGRFSMAMKNHFGTFSPGWGHSSIDGNGLNYLLSINQTPEILGPLDKRTGKILYPRQQLCLIDGLWATGDTYDELQTNFLTMGVFAPAVDYQVATKFRAERMGWKVNMKATQRMLTDFGYNESDLPEGGRLLEV